MVVMMVVLEIKGVLRRSSQLGTARELLGDLPAAGPAIFAMPADVMGAASILQGLPLGALLLLLLSFWSFDDHQFHALALVLGQHGPLTRDGVNTGLGALSLHLLPTLLREAPFKLAIRNE